MAGRFCSVSLLGWAVPRVAAGIACLPVWAQEAADRWSKLSRLSAGDRIEVVNQELKVLKGTFLRFSEESLSVRVRDQEVTLARSDVFRVSVRSHQGRKRRLLLGLAIGAGAGPGAGILIARASANEVACSESAGCQAAIAAPFIGAGVGLAAGLALGYHTVYRGRRRASMRPPELPVAPSRFAPGPRHP